MLTVRKIGSLQAGDYSGYLTGRANTEHQAWQAHRGDYYTGPTDGAPDAAGVWHGDPSALASLGVDQDSVVEQQALARALRGQRTDTGEQLRRPGANGVVNSHDLTMGVPKSVSVLWAQSDGERRAAIELATREAAEATVRYMALTTACVQRRTDAGDRVWESARGVAAAHFVHHTARRAKSADAPDPHLHIHCVVVGVERSDGTFVTPNQAAWVRAGREGGAYFRAELASRLVELGLAIEPGTGKQGRFFELAAVPRGVCDRLSGRAREAEAAYAAFVARYGRLPEGAELADLAAKSRERKGPETVAEIEPYWRAVAAEHGFDTRVAEAAWTGRNQHRPLTVEQLGNELVRRVEQQGATVRSRELRAMAYELAAGHVGPNEAMSVVAELQQRGELVALSDDRVTTRRTRAQERYCLDTASRLAQDSAPQLSEAATRAGAVAGMRATRGEMSTEQRAAFEQLAGSERLGALVGRAGTGKGVVISAVTEAYVADGWHVIAVATQGARAQGLGAQARGDVMTINQLVHRVRSGRLALHERSLIVVDEAGMVDTHRMADLLHLCDTHGASIRLVGDPAQLSAIGPGGLLPRILDLDRVPCAELEQIHRTPHQWLRDFQNLVRDGRSSEALDILHAHHAAHMLDTQGEAMQRMVDDWDQWRHDHAPGDTLMVVHTSNADVDTVNILAQAKRRQAGELGDGSVASPDRDYRLHEGDRVMLREKAYYLNDRDQPRIENGTRGTITATDTSRNAVTVQLEERGRAERSVEIDLERCAALRLDYASHVYPAQGDTRTRTAELTGGPSLSRESAYVGGSRLRERHDLYTSREALGTDGSDTERWNRLAAQMNDSRAQLPSIAYTEQPDRQIAAHVPLRADDKIEQRLRETERQLADATRLLDELRRTYPAALEREIAQIEADWRRTRDSFRHAEQRIANAQRSIEAAQPWQRTKLNEARQRLAHDTSQRDRLMAEANELYERHSQLTSRADTPAAWKRDHGDELAAREQRVADLTRDRDQQRERIIEHVVSQPPRYITRVLGDRPADAGDAKTWADATRSIELYRRSYGVADRHIALGKEPKGDHKRWLAFERTVGDVTRARDALGRSNREHTFAPDRAVGLAIMRGRRGISRER